MAQREIDDAKSLNEIEQEDIAKYLSELYFKKKLIGGVDSLDVWKRMRKIVDMYEQILSNQRIQYEALLADRERQIAELMRASGQESERDKEP